MAYSVAAALGIDVTRPIGRLDWIRGFSTRQHRVEAVMSGVIISLPTESGGPPTFRLTHQTAGYDFPIEKARQASLGTFYYIDTFQSVEAHFSETSDTWLPGTHGGTQVPERCSLPATLSADRMTVYVNEYPDFIRDACERHAALGRGIAILAIRLERNDLLLVPCGILALSAFAPIVRRGAAILAGDWSSQFPSLFDGFIFQPVADEGRPSRNVVVYPYRIERYGQHANVEASSLVTRALSMHTANCGMPFVVRMPTFGRVRLNGKMLVLKHGDRNTYLALTLSLSHPFATDYTLQEKISRFPYRWAPALTNNAVWLNAIPGMARRAPTRFADLHDANSLAPGRDIERYIGRWCRRLKGDEEKLRSVLFHSTTPS